MTTVLLVEDDPVYRNVLAETVAAAGFVVVPAEGVRDALLLCRAQPPDLALVDLRLPDGSGVDVVRFLAGTFPACRSIVLSGHATVPTAVEAMRAGAVDVLTKPVEGTEILAALRDAVEPSATEALDQVERAHILSVLQATGGNITEAAKRLGLYRRTLQRKLQRLPPAR